MEQSGEWFDFGLEKCVMEASSDFDKSPAGQPPAKKTWQQKMATRKEQEHLVKEVRAFSLHELTTICLDAIRFKLMEHVNPLVKEFAMAFEPGDIFLVCCPFLSSITLSLRLPLTISVSIPKHVSCSLLTRYVLT